MATKKSTIKKAIKSVKAAGKKIVKAVKKPKKKGPRKPPTSFQELPIQTCKTSEDIDQVLQDYLKLSLLSCGEALSTSLNQRAEELMPEMINLSPYGDYGKLTEDKTIMLDFLKTEAAKPENWAVQFIDFKENNQLMEMVFFNKAVDEGDVLKGYVFAGLSGKIRHCFCQLHD